MPELQYAPRAAPQIFGLYYKTRNFVSQFAQINRALFENENKKKILILKPSSKVGFKRPFKTASNVLKKAKLDVVFNKLWVRYGLWMSERNKIKCLVL